MTSKNTNGRCADFTLSRNILTSAPEKSMTMTTIQPERTANVEFARQEGNDSDEQTNF